MTGVELPGLLSVGVPVRNGGDLLQRALDSIAAQTYDQVEIVISDNASNDETAAICEAFVAGHPNARYVRQPTLITATENFRFVWEQSRGEYFMWAAHDDDRAPDFGAALVAALRRQPDAGLAYPTLLVESGADGAITEAPFARSTAGMPFHERVRWPWWDSCLPIFGVFRRAVLDGYSWYDGNGSPDVPLLSYVAVASEIIHEPGPTFTYRLVRKRSDQLAGTASFRTARINWAAARAAADARSRRPASVLPTFARLEGSHLRRRVIQRLTQGRRWEPLLNRRRDRP